MKLSSFILLAISGRNACRCVHVKMKRRPERCSTFLQSKVRLAANLPHLAMKNGRAFGVRHEISYTSNWPSFGQWPCDSYFFFTDKSFIVRDWMNRPKPKIARGCVILQSLWGDSIVIWLNLSSVSPITSAFLCTFLPSSWSSLSSAWRICWKIPRAYDRSFWPTVIHISWNA